LLVPFAVAAALYVAAFVLVLALRPFDESLIVAFDDIGGLAAPLSASVFLLLASRSAAANVRTGWFLLGVAILSWGVGDLLWATYEVALDQEAPFPSLADGFYLAGYPLMFVGVLCFFHRDRVSMSLRTTLDAIAVTLAGSAIVWRFAVEPLLKDSSLDLVDKVLSSAYPMGDVLVLFALALAVFRHRDGPAGTVFGVFALGMLVVLVSDVVFAYLENAGTYTSGSLVDVGWVIGFLLMGFGGVLQLAWQPQYVTQSDELADPAWKQVSPLVIMVAITSWIILDGFDGSATGIPLLGAVILMMFAVVVRHFLTLRENIELRRVLERAYRAEHDRARTDSLTGTLNRRAVVELVDGLLAFPTDKTFAVGMVDIDSMKRINDGFGHQCGDEALAELATVLADGAVVGRYGGDEFIVVLHDPQTIADYRSKVDAALSSWSTRRTDGLKLAVSIGFAISPADGRGAAELIRLADQRMYYVKRSKLAA
jgi:diguanylate cyclase (GGDEF)-like protein